MHLLHVLKLQRERLHTPVKMRFYLEEELHAIADMTGAIATVAPDHAWGSDFVACCTAQHVHRSEQLGEGAEAA